MLERLVNTFNILILFPRDERQLLYALLRAQMRAGIPVSTACSTLYGLSGLSSNLHKVVKAGAQASHEGRLVVDGLADTHFFPPEEIGVLRIAEANGQLPDALEAIELRAGESLGFFSQVIAPNLYYLVILTILLGFAWQTQSFLESIAAFDVSRNVAYLLSAQLNEWGPLSGLVVAGLIALIWYGKQTWTGRGRRVLLFFDLEARYQFSITFCALAGMLVRQGAANTEILDAAQAVMGHNRYARHHIRTATQAVIGEGQAWEVALGGGLLTQEHASLLQGLVPGGKRDLYEQAWRTLGVIQRQLLRARYRRVMVFLRVSVLVSIVYLFATLGEGLYSLFDAIET